MGYEDTSYADIFALTRQCRRERLFPTVRASASDTFEFDGSKAFKDLRALPKAILNSIRRKAKKVARQNRPRYMVPDRERTARYLSNAMFDRLRELQANRCYLCVEPFTAEDGPTCDHVVPQAHGGRNAGNILLAHAHCNNVKADRLPSSREIMYLRAIKQAIIGPLPPNAGLG